MPEEAGWDSAAGERRWPEGRQCRSNDRTPPLLEHQPVVTV